MKKLYTLTLCLFFFSINTWGQEELSLHFMRELGQAQMTNPALRMKYGLHIGGPSIGFNFQHVAFGLDEVLRLDGRTLYLSPNEAIRKASVTGNLARFNSTIQTFSVAARIKNLQLGFYHSINTDSYLKYPKALPDFLWNGNAAFVGDTLEVAPQVDFQLYSSYVVSIGHQVSEQFGIGLNLKFYRGAYSIRTDSSSFRFYNNPEYFQMTAMTDAAFRTSGFPSDPFSGDYSESLLRRIIQDNNKGLGIDFGITYKINEHWNVALSILDVGNITWKDEVYTQTSKGTYTFDGLEVNPFQSEVEYDYDEIRDSIKNTFEFQEQNEPFTNQVPTKLFFSADYNWSEKLHLGALFHGNWQPYGFDGSFLLSARQQVGKVFYGGLTTGYRGGGGFNLGLNCSVRFSGIQLYALADHILPFFNLLNTRSLAFRFGGNLAFIDGAKKDQEEQIKKLEEIERQRFLKPGEEFYDRFHGR